jgi:hypothetical protein
MGAHHASLEKNGGVIQVQLLLVFESIKVQLLLVFESIRNIKLWWRSLLRGLNLKFSSKEFKFYTRRG